MDETGQGRGSDGSSHKIWFESRKRRAVVLRLARLVQHVIIT